MPAWGVIAIAAGIGCIMAILGTFFGFWLRKPVSVGTLLVVTDPVDGEKYLTLEVQRARVDEIYDGNEVTVTVIERVGKSPQK